MVVLAIIIGGVIGGLVAVFGTLLARGGLGIRVPGAVDPGAGVGAVVGIVAYQLAF